MTVRKAILLTLILPAIVLCIALVATLRTGNWNSSGAMLFLLVIFALWAIGLLIGVIVSAIFQKPNKEPYFYLAGHFSIILTIAAFFAINKYNNWQHEKQFGNTEHNLSEAEFYSTYPAVDSVPIKALKKLESTFRTPNDFRIESSFCYREDTVVNNFIDTLRIVTFTYTQIDQPQLLFSKITVLNNVARLDIVGEKASASAEYAKVLRKKNKLDREFQERMKELNEQLSDSDKKTIKKLLQGE